MIAKFELHSITRCIYKPRSMRRLFNNEFLAKTSLQNKFGENYPPRAKLGENYPAKVKLYENYPTF